MVYLDEVAMARLKGGESRPNLQLTEKERLLVGQYFRLQIPIVDRGTLKDYAPLLRRIADHMDVAASMWGQRDYQLISVIKGEFAFANAAARRIAMYKRTGDDPFGDPAETQSLVVQAGQE